MTRYDFVQVNACYTTDHEMEPADDGEWVRYEEAEAALTTLRTQLQALVKEMRIYRTSPAVPKQIQDWADRLTRLSEEK